jgi:hypothetical protein
MGDIINEMELIGRMQSLGAGHGANSEQIKMRSEVKMMESLASSKRLLALGKLEDPDHWTFGDGDQSSLSGDDGQVYREFWSEAHYCILFVHICSLIAILFAGTGGDYAPGQSKTMSQWSADCYNGDLDEIKAHLKREPRLVDRRESVLRKNGLFHVINGTRATGILKGPPSSARRYLACAKYLVEKGTPVECRTVTGSSPLMQCTGGRGNKYTLMIADYLLEVGADINARDRFGCTAIIVPTSAGNDLIVDWLLENGADVDVTDNNGLSPMQLVQSFPSFRKKFTAANLKKNKQERREAMKMGSYQVCVVCENPAEKRCSGCYVVWYCDIECQNKNWSEHKSQCKQTRKEYVEAGLKFDSTATNHSNVVSFGNLC